MLRSDPRLTLEVREDFQGLDIEKAKFATLHLSLIRPAEPTLAARPGSPERR
jgi:hypothetical protein